MLSDFRKKKKGLYSSAVFLSAAISKEIYEGIHKTAIKIIEMKKTVNENCINFLELAV